MDDPSRKFLALFQVSSWYLVRSWENKPWSLWEDGLEACVNVVLKGRDDPLQVWE